MDDVLSGDKVIGATINKSGAFTFRAAEVGADTLLAQIVELANLVQTSRLGPQPSPP